MDEMTLDNGIRGNFMRIVEFEILGDDHVGAAHTNPNGSQITLQTQVRGK